MLESIQFAELLVQSRRDDLERVVHHQALLLQIHRPKRGWCPRHAFAHALMRLAVVIDKGAEGRARA